MTQEWIKSAPELWVESFLESNGITYDYKTDSIRQAGEIVDHGALMASLRLGSLRQDAAGIRAFLSDALLLWKRRQEAISLSRLREALRFQPPHTNWLAQWTKAATGRSSELDIAVVKHFVWQVKRKIYRLPVQHHLMPILYGKSGGGKSVAVHLLLGPLRDFSLNRDMTAFSDTFGKRQFARNFVMFFDELSKSNAVDVDTMKNVITAPTIEWRVMRSEGVCSSPQNCTFIACSNDPVAERINDPTSARRFWQLNCADQLDWESINSIDYEALWRSVDENSDCLLLPILPEIQAFQNREIRSRDLIEQWLEASCSPAPFDAVSPSTNELFDHFKKWCAWQGVTVHAGLQKFARSLDAKSKALGWTMGSKHSNRGTVWAVKTLPSVGTINSNL